MLEWRRLNHRTSTRGPFSGGRNMCWTIDKKGCLKATIKLASKRLLRARYIVVSWKRLLIRSRYSEHKIQQKKKQQNIQLFTYPVAHGVHVRSVSAEGVLALSPASHVFHALQDVSVNESEIWKWEAGHASHSRSFERVPCTLAFSPLPHTWWLRHAKMADPT